MWQLDGFDLISPTNKPVPYLACVVEYGFAGENIPQKLHGGVAQKNRQRAVSAVPGGLWLAFASCQQAQAAPRR
jgi:hypothetical protein